MASLDTIVGALASALEPIGDEIEDFQVVPILWWNASPPCIDIYPADPAQEEFAFGVASAADLWTVRARVSTVETEGNQLVLLQLMESSGGTSVRAALLDDVTLGGVVSGLRVGRPSGYQVFVDASGQGSLLGVEWLVATYSDEGDVS